jgi:hypothetical protein
VTEQTIQQDDSTDDWGDEGPAPSGVGFPEMPVNPHNHVYTWSPKLPDGSMLVIRANSAEELAAYAEALAPVAGRLRAAWASVTGGTPPPSQGAPNPFQAQAQAFPQGQSWPQSQQAPNQPFAGQPAWQQAGASQGGGGQGNQRGPKPRPSWPQVYKINVPYQAKDAFKAFREQNAEPLKGKVAWAGGGDYWIEGSVVSGFAQYNPVPA